ncbi:MAG: cell division protein FtsW [Chloroflexi bacterium]|nr:cell division protein FtsW [Chloroflexota bacterium]
MDLGLLVIVLAILVLGLVMVYSASYGFALIEGGVYEGQPAHFLKRQAMFALFGFVMLLILSRIDYHIYQKYVLWILGGTVLMLVTMTLGIGRWLVNSRSVQPSELAKLGAMIYIAVWLAAKGENLRSVNLGLIPFALLLGFIAGLIMLQPDFSTGLLLVATATAMFFVAGADIKQLLIGFLFGGLALVLMAMAMRYRMDRINLWLQSPFSDVSGQGFQVVQSLAALNKGGWVGVGLGQSQQKFAIYAAHTDGIFAIVGEEMGILGCLLVMGLYGLWTWRGLRIAWAAPDMYGRLLAVGLVAWVTLQAILHIGVITATTPFTGTVLPFISYGGSSLVSCLASVGILLNISRHGPGEESEHST